MDHAVLLSLVFGGASIVISIVVAPRWHSHPPCKGSFPTLSSPAFVAIYFLYGSHSDLEGIQGIWKNRSGVWEQSPDVGIDFRVSGRKCSWSHELPKITKQGGGLAKKKEAMAQKCEEYWNARGRWNCHSNKNFLCICFLCAGENLTPFMANVPIGHSHNVSSATVWMQIPLWAPVFEHLVPRWGRAMWGLTGESGSLEVVLKDPFPTLFPSSLCFPTTDTAWVTSHRPSMPPTNPRTDCTDAG